MTLKTKIERSGSTVELCAMMNYRQSEPVTWKKVTYTPEEVKARKHMTLADNSETIATGLSCQYTFTKKDEGKYVRFHAYVNAIQTCEQIVVYYVEPVCKTEIRIAA